jgi:hypothetical protein
LSVWVLSQAATSASTACPNSVLAPLRKTSVSGSENVPGCPTPRDSYKNDDGLPSKCGYLWPRISSRSSLFTYGFAEISIAHPVPTKLNR